MTTYLEKHPNQILVYSFSIGKTRKNSVIFYWFCMSQPFLYLEFDSHDLFEWTLNVREFLECLACFEVGKKWNNTSVEATNTFFLHATPPPPPPTPLLLTLGLSKSRFFFLHYFFKKNLAFSLVFFSVSQKLMIIL